MRKLLLFPEDTLPTHFLFFKIFNSTINVFILHPMERSYLTLGRVLNP
jgi:hypothetical protein